MEIVWFLISCFILYAIIAIGVKAAVRDALFEFREDMMKDLQELIDRNKDTIK